MAAYELKYTAEEIDGILESVDEKTIYGDATQSEHGLMSVEDKTKIDALPTAQQIEGSLSGKADKVSNATSGNFAGLDANGNLTDSGSKESDFATPSDIDTAFENYSPTFVCSYGVTTYSDIMSAYNSGKRIIVDRNRRISELSLISARECWFFRIQTNNTNHIVIRKTTVTPDDEWSEDDLRLEDITDKVSTIAGNETNTTKYPNTKAVADYAQTISNKVTSFQATPDDTHYPSEKLVKDSLDTKIDNTDVEALTAIDVDDTPTANSSNLVTSGGVYNALINKQDKMPISSASGTTLSAIANAYHNFTSEVNTLAITLPAVTDVTHITEIVFMLTTGTTPAITFAASGTGVNVIAQDGFSIEASTTYEINAIFNGTMWVVAAMKLSTTDIQQSNP